MLIQPGIRIRCNGRDGTLGLLVVRDQQPDTVYLLSAWHVLDDFMGEGDVTLPDHNHQLVARYQRSEATAHPEMDIALAEVHPDFHSQLSNTTVDGNNTISEAAYWRRNMPLSKYGATTQRTRSRLVDDTDNFGNLLYGLVLGKYPGGVDQYCHHGDSGAIWCDAISGKAIGMHSKGGLTGNQAAASPLIVAMEDMGLQVLSTQRWENNN